MALPAGRVGVKPDQVDWQGNIIGGGGGGTDLTPRVEHLEGQVGTFEFLVQNGVAGYKKAGADTFHPFSLNSSFVKEFTSVAGGSVVATNEEIGFEYDTLIVLSNIDAESSITFAYAQVEWNYSEVEEMNIPTVVKVKSLRAGNSTSGGFSNYGIEADNFVGVRFSPFTTTFANKPSILIALKS